MKRIALSVEYAGDGFEGWQSQRHGRTVQDKLERAIAKISGHAVRLHCAGRTDTGVHATAQVTHFDTPAERPSSAWVRGVNGVLDDAPVKVRWAIQVADDFHARFSAFGRRYRYILHNAPTPPALLASKVGWFHRPLDTSAMAQAAALLVGEHDFSSFRASACQAKTPVRRMHSVSVVRDGEYVVFDFHATSFLHHMVRNLVGALVYVGKGTYGPEWIEELLAARNRHRAAPTFVPGGLYLCGVDYPARWPLPDDGRIIAVPRLPFI